MNSNEFNDILKSSVYTTFKDVWFRKASFDCEKTGKKNLILFFPPFGNRFTNYFLKILFKNVFNKLFEGSDFYMEEYYYYEKFNQSSLFFLSGIYGYKNALNLNVLKDIINDIQIIKKTNNYKKIYLFGFSQGGLFIHNLMDLLIGYDLTTNDLRRNSFDSQKLIDGIITINSPLFSRTISDSEPFVKSDSEPFVESDPAKIDTKNKWIHIYDTDYSSVNNYNPMIVFKIISSSLQNRPYNWFKTYVHFRWILDLDIYKYLVDRFIDLDPDLNSNLNSKLNSNLNSNLSLDLN